MLSRVCRRIRHESLFIYLARNKFVASAKTATERITLRGWLLRLGPALAAQTGKLRICCSTDSYWDSSSDMAGWDSVIWSLEKAGLQRNALFWELDLRSIWTNALHPYILWPLLEQCGWSDTIITPGEALRRGTEGLRAGLVN